MKINNTAFGRVQNKALKAGVGEALDAIVKKVDDVDSRMLNYMGDWVSGNEYLENDVVTWAHDGHLYEVIKAHTSSATFDPDNPEYYKAMTAAKFISVTSNVESDGSFSEEVKNAFNNPKMHNAKIKLIAGNNAPYYFNYIPTDNYLAEMIGASGNNLTILSANLYITTINKTTGCIPENRIMVVTFKDNAVTINIVHASKITLEFLA